MINNPPQQDNQVPQKILGPLTSRQFIIVVIGGSVVFLAYKLAPLGVFLGVSLAVIIVVAVLMKQKL